MMNQLRVGLLFGGRSGEHEVSIRSAAAAARALQAGPNGDRYRVLPFYLQKDGLWQGPATAQAVLDRGLPLPSGDQPADRSALWHFPPEVAEVDVWFPTLHGPNGEDGSVQGLLQLMQVPWVGSGVLGSAAGMDKIAMKMLFAQAGLPQVKYRLVTRSQVWSNPCVFPKLCDELEAELGYPCFVKPANLGSSVGIAKARSRAELEAALDSAASFDRRIIVEAAASGKPREVECAVLGNDQPAASVIGEITFSSEFYDYETKYSAGAADLVIPAQLPADVVDRLQTMAREAFLALDCAGLARVDFFYVESTGEIFLNEINTLPGFTATSMYPQLWEATGVSFPELVDRLVKLAIDRHATGQEAR